jgi:PAS domain S-box-containing protein
VTSAERQCTLVAVTSSEPEGAARLLTDAEPGPRSADHLAALVDLLPDGLMAFDREGRCVLFNDSACQILGRRREEWMGKTLSQVAPAALGSTFDRAFQRCHVERVTTALEQSYYPPRDRWYQSIFRPSGDGGVLLQFRNVTFESAPGPVRGVIPLDLEPSDLTTICREVVDEVRSDSTGRPLLLISHGDTRGAWDRAWMTQVVASLLGHALGEGLPGTAVRVAVREASSEVTLAVQHLGSLLPAGRIRALFDPSPGDEPRAPSQGSRLVGLGLFLSKRIVEAHGGSIRAESSAANGTTLTAELPRAGAVEIESRPVPT